MADKHSCGLCRIELEGLGVRFAAETALRDIHLHLHCGQLTALIGPNGGGKTTLIRALLGEIPYTGEIKHVDHCDKPFPGLRIGYVPQSLPFDKQMPVSVEDLMALSLSRRPVFTGLSRKTRERSREALALSQAEGLKKRKLGALSGGELQRVLLALALSPMPDLLILDEPVSGVDQNGLALFLETIERLKTQKHLAILMVSHDWSMVSRYADTVLLMNKTLLAAGTPADVFSSPAFKETFPVSWPLGATP